MAEAIDDIELAKGDAASDNMEEDMDDFPDEWMVLDDMDEGAEEDSEILQDSNVNRETGNEADTLKESLSCNDNKSLPIDHNKIELDNLSNISEDENILDDVQDQPLAGFSSRLDRESISDTELNLNEADAEFLPVGETEMDCMKTSGFLKKDSSLDEKVTVQSSIKTTAKQTEILSHYQNESSEIRKGEDSQTALEPNDKQTSVSSGSQIKTVQSYSQYKTEIRTRSQSRAKPPEQSETPAPVKQVIQTKTSVSPKTPTQPKLSPKSKTSVPSKLPAQSKPISHSKAPTEPTPTVVPKPSTKSKTPAQSKPTVQLRPATQIQAPVQTKPSAQSKPTAQSTSPSLPKSTPSSEIPDQSSAIQLTVLEPSSQNKPSTQFKTPDQQLSTQSKPEVQPKSNSQSKPPNQPGTSLMPKSAVPPAHPKAPVIKAKGQTKSSPLTKPADQKQMTPQRRPKTAGKPDAAADSKTAQNKTISQPAVPLVLSVEQKAVAVSTVATRQEAVSGSTVESSASGPTENKAKLKIVGLADNAPGETVVKSAVLSTEVPSAEVEIVTSEKATDVVDTKIAETSISLKSTSSKDISGMQVKHQEITLKELDLNNAETELKQPTNIITKLDFDNQVSVHRQEEKMDFIVDVKASDTPDVNPGDVPAEESRSQSVKDKPEHQEKSGDKSDNRHIKQSENKADSKPESRPGNSSSDRYEARSLDRGRPGRVYDSRSRSNWSAERRNDSNSRNRRSGECQVSSDRQNVSRSRRYNDKPNKTDSRSTPAKSNASCDSADKMAKQLDRNGKPSKESNSADKNDKKSPKSGSFSNRIGKPLARTGKLGVKSSKLGIRSSRPNIKKSMISGKSAIKNSPSASSKSNITTFTKGRTENRQVTVSKNGSPKNKNPSSVSNSIIEDSIEKNTETEQVSQLSADEIKKFVAEQEEELLKFKRDIMEKALWRFAVRFSPLEYADLAQETLRKLMNTSLDCVLYFHNQSIKKKKSGEARLYFPRMHATRMAIQSLFQTSLVSKRVQIEITRKLQNSAAKDTVTLDMDLSTPGTLASEGINSVTKGGSFAADDIFVQVANVPKGTTQELLLVIFPSAVAIHMPKEGHDKGPVKVDCCSIESAQDLLRCYNSIIVNKSRLRLSLKTKPREQISQASSVPKVVQQAVFPIPVRDSWRTEKVEQREIRESRELKDVMATGPNAPTNKNRRPNPRPQSNAKRPRIEMNIPAQMVPVIPTFPIIPPYIPQTSVDISGGMWEPPQVYHNESLKGPDNLPSLEMTIVHGTRSVEIKEAQDQVGWRELGKEWQQESRGKDGWKQGVVLPGAEAISPDWEKDNQDRESISPEWDDDDPRLDGGDQDNKEKFEREVQFFKKAIDRVVLKSDGKAQSARKARSRDRDFVQAIKKLFASREVDSDGRPSSAERQSSSHRRRSASPVNSFNIRSPTEHLRSKSPLGFSASRRTPQKRLRSNSPISVQAGRHHRSKSPRGTSPKRRVENRSPVRRSPWRRQRSRSLSPVRRYSKSPLGSSAGGRIPLRSSTQRQQGDRRNTLRVSEQRQGSRSPVRSVLRRHGSISPKRQSSHWTYSRSPSVSSSHGKGRSRTPSRQWTQTVHKQDSPRLSLSRRSKSRSPSNLLVHRGSPLRKVELAQTSETWHGKNPHQPSGGERPSWPGAGSGTRGTWVQVSAVPSAASNMSSIYGKGHVSLSVTEPQSTVTPASSSLMRTTSSGPVIPGLDLIPGSKEDDGKGLEPSWKTPISFDRSSEKALRSQPDGRGMGFTTRDTFISPGGSAAPSPENTSSAALSREEIFRQLKETLLKQDLVSALLKNKGDIFRSVSGQLDDVSKPTKQDQGAGWWGTDKKQQPPIIESVRDMDQHANITPGNRSGVGMSINSGPDFMTLRQEAAKHLATLEKSVFVPGKQIQKPEISKFESHGGARNVGENFVVDYDHQPQQEKQGQDKLRSRLDDMGHEPNLSHISGRGQDWGMGIMNKSVGGAGMSRGDSASFDMDTLNSKGQMKGRNQDWGPEAGKGMSMRHGDNNGPNQGLGQAQGRGQDWGLGGSGGGGGSGRMRDWDGSGEPQNLWGSGFLPSRDQGVVRPQSDIGFDSSGRGMLSQSRSVGPGIGFGQKPENRDFGPLSKSNWEVEAMTNQKKVEWQGGPMQMGQEMASSWRPIGDQGGLQGLPQRHPPPQSAGNWLAPPPRPPMQMMGPPLPGLMLRPFQPRPHM